ncbi:PREDICTED: transcription factor bHLH121-like [Populus euphratica]|uniref:Transcription factor bHLH121-like n=1 Tax=Populus euphratica TaxID=75702 RepID=A0AAJ6TGY8_POPEU|nr:PREDICTED: transcription factor bHLH121-like [Populus euphratica]
MEVKDPIAVAREVQKADTEKLRDNLYEQFLELDSDRPKNDKATVLTDVIQLEKNELREERASLKADIENLNAQYRQKARAMFPWAVVDPTVVIPPPYSPPVPVPVPPGPIHIHPSLQPFVFFGNQNPGAIASPCFNIYSSGSHFSSNQDSRSKLTDHQRVKNKDVMNLKCLFLHNDAQILGK